MHLRRCWLIVLLLTLPLQAAEPPNKPAKEPPKEGKVLKEVWEAAFLEGGQAGFIHSIYRELKMGDQTVIEGAVEMDLTVVRFGQTLRQSFTIGDHETAGGKVIGVLMKQDLGKEQGLLIVGKVEGDQLNVQVKIGANPPIEKKVPWDTKKEVLGLYSIEKLFENRKLEPNTKFDFLRYEPVFNAILANHVEIKDYEEVALLDGKKRRLLRAETKIDKIMGVEFPPEMVWLDEKGTPVKRQIELPGMGQIVTYRTTKELATAKVGKPAVDIGIAQLIAVKTPIPRPNDTREVIFRVQLKDDKEPQTAFAADDRQEIRNVKDDQCEIVVHGLQAPGKPDPKAETPEEHLKSNHFVRSDDAKVKELAAKAVGKETDPWKKALAIERWVRQNLKNKNFTETFATADEVARTLEGDCTEHAMLAAAMCRAAGVPSRTAIGLVYVPGDKAMSFHMWMEVWIGGKWYALDPTLGQGRVGASHLKITDHHWNDVQSFTPLLPVVRVLGKIQVEVVSFRHE